MPCKNMLLLWSNGGYWFTYRHTNAHARTHRTAPHRTARTACIQAVACYRHAIRTDSRHYNAWYGLGTIYYRQEKFDLAE